MTPCIPLFGAYNRRDLVPGREYLWCACGRSDTQPYCDEKSCGKFKPVKFTAKDQTVHSLCGCKYTCNPPFCDATHIKLSAEPTGTPPSQKPPFRSEK